MTYGSQAEQAVSALKERGLHVALAESCTGGLVAKMLTDVPGASEVFECGVVSYANRIKSNVLGVPATLMEEHSVVSAPVAVAMARGVRNLGEADLGIGITGVAGPGPDGEHPEGEIFVALSDGETDHVVHLQTGTTDRRAENRRTAAETAFSLIQTYLTDEPK